MYPIHGRTITRPIYFKFLSVPREQYLIILTITIDNKDNFKKYECKNITKIARMRQNSNHKLMVKY